MKISFGDREFIEKHKVELREWAPPVCVVGLIIVIFTLAMLTYRTIYMNKSYNEQLANLGGVKKSATASKKPKVTDEGGEVADETVRDDKIYPATILPGLKDIYDQNHDTVGWLMIDDTVVDYPVMQTPSDEEYYLERDFQGNYSAYGCLIMDTDSVVGTGTADKKYKDGSRPSTNLIIHGHNMKNGTMFGGLDKYRKQDYEKQHSIIKFSSLYEEREYEIVSVFLSQVYLKTQNDVFKYYKFFEATSQEEFDDFYNNIKKLQLYDTGVDAKLGDEFITLSVCAYHVENGRLVVVAKRIK